MAHGPIADARALLDGFGMGESPRWHEGRLWFSSWGTDEIVAVDLEGNSEVIGAGLFLRRPNNLQQRILQRHPVVSRHCAAAAGFGRA